MMPATEDAIHFIIERADSVGHSGVLSKHWHRIHVYQ
jgi:hypothetical protein